MQWETAMVTYINIGKRLTALLAFKEALSGNGLIRLGTFLILLSSQDVIDITVIKFFPLKKRGFWRKQKKESTGLMEVISGTFPTTWTSVWTDSCGPIERHTLQWTVRSTLIVLRHLITRSNLQSCYFSEVKYVYQPIKASFHDQRLKVLSLSHLFQHIFWIFFSLFQIRNAYFFGTTRDLEFTWSALGDGHEIGSGGLSLPVIEPQNCYDVEFSSCPWYELWEKSSAVEFFVTITVKLVNSTIWAESGHVVASSQLQLPSKTDFVPHVTTHSL